MSSQLITDPDERQLESLRTRLRRAHALWNQMTEELVSIEEALRPIWLELSTVSASKVADLTSLTRTHGGFIPVTIYRGYMDTREARLETLSTREGELMRRWHAMQRRRADVAEHIQVLQQNINDKLTRMGRPAVPPAQRRI